MTELLIEVTRDRRTSSVHRGRRGASSPGLWKVVCVIVFSCALSALSPHSLLSPLPSLLLSSHPFLLLSSALSPRSLRALSAGRRLRVASIAALSEGVASATCIERWAWRRTLRVTLHSLFTHSSLTLHSRLLALRVASLALRSLQRNAYKRRRSAHGRKRSL